MNREKTHFAVDDYLDLYLLAEALGDKLWQQEVMGKLQNHKQEISKNPDSTIHNLWDEYRNINTKILDLYRQLRNHSSNNELHEKIWDLKQQRMSLSRKLYFEERNY